MAFFKRKPRVLLVCTANVCRSPMAEAIMRHELQRRGIHRKITVESAGTCVSQPGRAVDFRVKKICAAENVDIGKRRARQVVERDFSRFDHILAMDQQNFQWLLEACPECSRERVSLLGPWAIDGNLVDIPDPYYGNLAGFERIFSMLRDSISGFLTLTAEDLISDD